MSLNLSEFKRFEKQIILKKIGISGQNKIKKSKVLIIGMGGLGCPLLTYLASAGIYNIGIADQDKVEVSNLNRQILFNTADLGKYKVIQAKSKINKIYKKLDLIDKYLSVRDENYLKWAIREILNWKQEKPLQEVIHIHGDRDLTFPISLIKDCIIVPGATHALILTKYRWLNKNLTLLIEEKKV